MQLGPIIRNTPFSDAVENQKVTPDEYVQRETNLNWFGLTKPPPNPNVFTNERKSKKKVTIVQANNDDTTKDFTYLDNNTEESATTLKTVGEEMADDINENEEFNNYTDTAQIGKRIFMAPESTVFASKLMITKIRVT